MQQEEETLKNAKIYIYVHISLSFFEKNEERVLHTRFKLRSSSHAN